MSFLSGSTRKLPSPPPRVAGLDESKTATAEQARPVPWLVGRQRIGVTYLTQAFDQITEEVKEEISKKDEEVTTGYNYFCSFAVLLCGCGQGTPADTVEKIYLDEKEAWSGSLVRGVDGTDYVDITVDGFGEVRFYFGTVTQAIDPTLASLDEPNANGVIEYHGAYRGFCYAVFKRFFLGYQRTSAPNIEFVVGRYPDIASLPNQIGGDTTLPAALADALTDPRMGLGLNSAIYDSATFTSVGSTLSTEVAGLSPFVTRRQPLRQVLTEMCEGVEAFHYPTTGGKIALGLVRPNPASVGTLSEDDLADVPQLTISGYEGTSNQVQLTFTNSAREWKEDVAIGDDMANRQIVQEPRSVTLRRPWVTKPETAWTMAYSAARTLAQPEMTGMLTLRRSRLGGIDVGKVFKFSYAQWGICALLCRCTEVHWPDPKRAIAEVSFRVEAGRFNKQETTPNPPTPPAVIVAEVEPFEYEAIMELPPIPELTKAPKIALLQFLAARPNLQTSRFKAHFERAPDSFEAVHTLHRFAWRVTIEATFAGDGTTVDEGSWLRFRIDSLEQEMPVVTLDEACRNKLILWTGPSMAPADSQFVSLWGVEVDATDIPDGSLVVGREYIVVGGVAVTHASVTYFTGDKFVAVNLNYTETLGTEQVYAVGVWRARAIRGRLDTKKAALTGGAVMWIVAQSGIDPYYVESEAPAQTYKLQPIVYGQALPLAEADELTVGIVRRALRPWRPANLRAFGTRNKPFYTSGQDIPITIDIAAVERGAFFASFGAGYTESLPWTELTFTPADGVGTVFVGMMAPGVTSFTLLNNSILANFGTQKSFWISARHMRNNLASLQAEELLVSFGAP